MKLIEVGDEHLIVMKNNGCQVMYHHQEAVAAKVFGLWYRGPNTNLISMGHVNRYLAHVHSSEVHWVSQERLDELVGAL